MSIERVFFVFCFAIQGFPIDRSSSNRHFEILLYCSQIYRQRYQQWRFILSMIYLYRYFVVLPHISHEFHDFLFFFVFGFAGKVLVHCQVIILIPLSRKYPFHSNRISRSIQFNSIPFSFVFHFLFFLFLFFFSKFRWEFRGLQHVLLHI